MATLGNSTDFPAFFTASSGIKSPIHLTDQSEAVRLIRSHESMQLNSGVLVAVPIPEHLAADGNEIQRAIDLSISKAK